MRHARAAFDWAVIIPQYLALAQELAALRARTPVSTPPLRSGAISPIEVDPFTLYADYPTAPITADTPIGPGAAVTVETIAALGRLSGHGLYRRQPAGPDILARAAALVREGGAGTVRDLARALSMSVETAGSLTLMLAKWDLVRLPEIPPRP